MRVRLLAVAATLVSAAACGSPPPADPQVLASNPPPRSSTSDLDASEPVRITAAGSAEVRLFAVGDIAGCNTTADDAVAKFLRARSAPIATLGDTVYESGSAKEFAQCWEPHWGPMFDRIHPAIGNHEYHTPEADGYFDYFGTRAGNRGEGWYGFNVGDHWRVIVLNGQCAEAGGCTGDSPQGQWLKAELTRAGSRNVIATMHPPRYSSGKHGSTLAVRPLFRILYRRGADILLSGHDHDYERFAPQNAIGERRENGVQQFVVGTGGRGLYGFGPRAANSRVRNNNTYGVLRLELRRHGYSWKFIPVRGDFTDIGSRSLG